jgi:hypothetical protein
MKFLSVSLAVILVMTLLPTGVVSADNDLPDGSPHILISEIQTRSVESSARFVVLYNPTSVPIDITGWKLEYKPVSGGTWANRLATTQPISPPYAVEPGEFFILATNDFVAQNPEMYVGMRLNNSALASNDGGHLRLLNPQSLLVDQVGWGKADSPMVKAAQAPDFGQSISRCFDEQGAMVDTGNNATDFIITEPLPGAGIDCPEPEEIAINECQGLMISEIGANLDTQFIEVYNSSKAALQLEGCQLQTNRSATKSYTFPRQVLDAKAFLAV